MLAAFLLLVGCEDDLPRPTLIKDMRLLGAKVEVVGDETRSTPRPGEEFDLTIPTVFPQLGQNASKAQSMLVTCTMPDRYTGGLPVCQELIDLATQAEVDPSALTDFDVKVSCAQVPDGFYELGSVTVRCLDGEPKLRTRVDPSFAGRQMLYRGVICERGRAFVDPQDPLLFGCEDEDAEQINFHGTVTIERNEEDRNYNPSMLDAEFRLSAPDQPGPLWPYAVVSDDDVCGAMAGEAWAWDGDTAERIEGIPTAGGPVLVVDDTGDAEIVLRFDPRAGADGKRSIELVDGEREELEFSIYATAGDLERRFVVLDEMDEPECPLPRREDSDTCVTQMRAQCIESSNVADRCEAPLVFLDDCPSGCAEMVRVASSKAFEARVRWDPPEGKKITLTDANGMKREAYAYDRGDGVMVPGLLVRFFVTVLDRRGGFDWTTRALCLK